MTSATPKPRAGEHMGTARQAVLDAAQYPGGGLSLVPGPLAMDHADELDRVRTQRDALLGYQQELVEALAELAGDIEGIYDYCKRKDLMVVNIGQFRRLNAARALLAKHGR